MTDPRTQAIRDREAAILRDNRAAVARLTDTQPEADMLKQMLGLVGA